jgi:hypothetical protein
MPSDIGKMSNSVHYYCFATDFSFLAPIVSFNIAPNFGPPRGPWSVWWPLHKYRLLKRQGVSSRSTYSQFRHTALITLSCSVGMLQLVPLCIRLGIFHSHPSRASTTPLSESHKRRHFFILPVPFLVIKKAPFIIFIKRNDRLCSHP